MVELLVTIPTDGVKQSTKENKIDTWLLSSVGSIHQMVDNLMEVWLERKVNKVGEHFASQV